jgi:uncharacterized protein (TIGR02391 family)
VSIFWDDIEILRVLDERETGVRSGIFNGLELMQAIAVQREVALTEEDYHSFVRELLALEKGGLVTWTVMSSAGRVREISPSDPNDYLQNIRDIALTVPDGRDRARNQMLQLPWPDPGEDDGHMISNLTLESIADAISREYDANQVSTFLAESGISLDYIPYAANNSASDEVLQTLSDLESGTSGQRRELRRFIGAWLDDRLHTGSSDDERTKIAADLARQGWFVRDGRLVVGEPVRGANRAGTDIARDARIAALHPTIREVSQRPFEAGEPAAAVLEAFKAVNNQVKERSASDADGQQLMARVFRPGDPVLYIADATSETGRSVQAGYHQMFMGAMLGIRNPHAHEHFPGLDENEALEQLGFASLLMRRLDDARLAGDGDVAGQ